MPLTEKQKEWRRQNYHDVVKKNPARMAKKRKWNRIASRRYYRKHRIAEIEKSKERAKKSRKEEALCWKGTLQSNVHNRDLWLKAENIGVKILEGLGFKLLRGTMHGHFDYFGNLHGKLYLIDATIYCRKQLRPHHSAIARFLKFRVAILFIRPSLTHYSLVEVEAERIKKFRKITVKPSKIQQIPQEYLVEESA